MDLSYQLIDFDYIDNFLNQEKEYNIFYKSNINSININIHYYKNNKINNSFSFEHTINNNILNSETLLYIIKKYSGDKYILDLIIYFNFDIDNNEIKKFINGNLPIYNYFKIYKNIIDLVIDDCIPFFSNLTSIDIFLKSKKNLKDTKRKNITQKNTTNNIKSIII